MKYKPDRISCVSKRGREAELHVVGSDLHFPHHDNAAVSLFTHWIKENKPDTIHLLGDVIDNYGVSGHSIDPQFAHTLQKDLDETFEYLAYLRSIAPDATIIYTEGNHETRLRRYLQRVGTRISGLRALELPRLLELDSLGIPYRTEQHPYRHGDLWFTHGNIVRKHSAYSARAMVERVGGSVIVGHTHRLGSHFVTDWSKSAVGYENGCLCPVKDKNLANSFVNGTPNWQQGFSVIQFDKWNNRWRHQVDQIKIENSSYVYNGSRYTTKQ